MIALSGCAIPLELLPVDGGHGGTRNHAATVPYLYCFPAGRGQNCARPEEIPTVKTGFSDDALEKCVVRIVHV